MNHWILAQQNPSAGLLGFLPIVFIVLIFYLLIYRPMRKRQRTVDTMLRNLKNGDKVITSGGIYGTIAGMKEQTVMLKVCGDIKLEVAKNAIAGLQATPSETAAT